MSADVLSVVVGLITFAWITRCWWLRRRGEREAADWRPDELRSARLTYAERLFRSTGPIPFSARVDRAYRDDRGHLMLVELKTRDLDKVYPSDVIELSVQRVAIIATTGETVHEEAYVLVQGAGGRPRHAHRVKLLTLAQVMALAGRWRALLSGTTPARRTYIEGICDRCAFATPCRPRSVTVQDAGSAPTPAFVAGFRPR